MCDQELHRGKYVCVHDVPWALDTASATTENPGFFDANVSTENPGLFDTKPSSVSWRLSGGPFALQEWRCNSTACPSTCTAQAHELTHTLCSKPSNRAGRLTR